MFKFMSRIIVLLERIASALEGIESRMLVNVPPTGGLVNVPPTGGKTKAKKTLEEIEGLKEKGAEGEDKTV